MRVREGQCLGRYTLIRRLGKGGGGEAWEAVLRGARGFTRPVALKFLREGVAEGPELDNLENEARIGALLHHPNVVGTYELAEIDGIVFIALELVRGRTVRELSREGPLPGAVLLDIGMQACAGLAHIHQTLVEPSSHGLVHRDIKPGNLLVDGGGVVKIADFGISRRVGDAVHNSGTPGYAPPEQFSGHADARSDLFALGATLANLILGEAPFGRKRAGVDAIRARLVDARFLARLDARIVGGSEVLARCLAPDPDDRFPTAGALAEALSALRSAQAPAPSLRQLVASSVGSGQWPTVMELTPQLTPPPFEPTVPTRGNLPPASDTFFGRPEFDALRSALLAGHRLISLTGPGGMGKTRLAIEAARRFVRGSGSAPTGGAPVVPFVGAWFFDLADASTLEGVLGGIARHLSLELATGVATDQVGHALRALGRAVVVFDNLEQVLDPARIAIERFLVLAPELVVLCTTRLPVRLPSEHRISIGPLPDDEAVALFRARAPRLVHEDELPEVRSLVRRLDGMPLPIELVAARAQTVSLADLTERLRTHLEAAADEDRPARHRSVEASLAWSWEMLPEWGRAAVGQLTVFDGGFTTRSAAAVLEPASLGSHTALDALDLLVDVGLVRYDPDTRRFALLSVVHAFATARLPAEVRLRAEVRHGRVFATAGQREVLDLLRGPQGTTRFEKMLADLDNLLAAARRAVARGDERQAIGAARAAGAVLMRRGPLSVALDLFDAVLAVPALSPDDLDELRVLHGRCSAAIGQVATTRPVIEGTLRSLRSRPAHPARARLETEALLLLADLHRVQRDDTLAEVTARAALTLALELGEAALAADASLVVASCLGNEGRLQESQDWCSTALVAYRQLGSDRDVARTLEELGKAQHTGGRFLLARATLQEALATCRQVSDRVREVAVLSDLGLLDKDLRRAHDADLTYREARRCAVELGNRHREMWVVGALGFLHLEQLDPADARAHLEAALAIAQELGDPLQAQWEAALGRLCAIEGDFDRAEGWITAALRHDAVRINNVRIWVRCAFAEIELRAGRRTAALRELDELQRWLTARNTEPGSRMHQEVQRVRVLIGETRR